MSPAQTWIAALLTLCVFTFLWRENPLSRLAEHLFVGLAAGYYAAVEYNTVVKPRVLGPLLAGPWHAAVPPLAVPLALTACLWWSLAPRGGRAARWPLAVLVGTYAGLGVVGALQADLVPQLRASLLPLAGPGLPAARVAGNLLALVGVASALFHFFHSAEPRGGALAFSRIGMYFLMVSFGAAFGLTVMGRLALLVDRLQFLLTDWLGLVPR